MTAPGKKILLGPLPPPYGGVSVFMVALSEEADAHDFSVWYTSGRIERRTENMHSTNHRRLSHIRRLLPEGRCARITDSTHFHLEYPHPLLLPLWIVMKALLRFRWIKVLHDGSLPRREEDFGFIGRWLLTLAIRHVDEIVVSNSDLADWIQKKRGFDGPVHVIPTLVEVPGGTDPPRSSAIDAAVLGADKIVSSVGVFIPSYGFHELAAAVEKVRSELSANIRLVLVDGQFADDAEYRHQLLDRRDWITVLRSIPHEVLPHIYRSSDVFVRPGRDESLGLSRIEAILSGTPVVGTNAGETRGVLTYEFGDIETLAEHLRSVLSIERPSLKDWRQQYIREAIQNRKRYLELITGRSAGSGRQ
jgi:glycosyltransferase involved in cell wall biosynthesis